MIKRFWICIRNDGTWVFIDNEEEANNASIDFMKLRSYPVDIEVPDV